MKKQKWLIIQKQIYFKTVKSKSKLKDYNKNKILKILMHKIVHYKLINITALKVKQKMKNN